MSELMDKLRLAEIYLQDGALQAALRCIREALQIASSNDELDESEDCGDMSTHLLQRKT